MLSFKKNILLKTAFNNLVFGTLILTLIFTRSFMGFKVFGFRLGELLVGLGLVLTFLLIVLKIFNIFSLNFFPYTYFYLVLVSFIFSLIVNNGSIFSLYTFKSSSYLWMIGYILFSYIFFRNFSFKNIHIFSIGLAPFIIYVFNSGNYPNFIMYFFQQNSDKFQFMKGSDVLMAFIFSTFILKDKIQNQKYLLLYVNILGALLLPLFLTLSRASFFSSFLFILFFNISMRKVLKKDIKQTIFLLFLFIFIFILSSVRLASLPDFSNNSGEPEVVVVIQESVSEVVERKNTNQFLGFYFCEDRLCSKDNTLDWRLDIWFDLVKDQLKKGKLIQGFGFNEIFEVMKDPNAPGRLGREGLNEHVHNHLFTIIGRMGLLGLIVYLLFLTSLLSSLGSKILIYILPLFLVTSFDTTMESIQFPLLFYFLISYFYSNSKN